MRLPVSLALFVLHLWTFRLLSTTTLGTFDCWNGSYTWLKKTGLGRFCLNRLAQPFHRQLTHALRSYVEPYGFDRMHPRVMHGNCLSFRSLVLMRVGRRCARPCGLEQPRRSKMAWLDEWISLVQSGDFEEAIIAACRFNSPHQKEFRFLLHRVSAELLEARCTRDHAHVRIQGKFTKDSAYIPLNLDFTLLWLSGLP